MLKSVIHKYNDTLIAAYIDQTAAYNHIPRNFLYRVLDFRTGASPLIAILYKMYQGTTASILMVGHLFQNYDTIYVRYFATYTCNHSCYTIYVRFFATYTCVLSCFVGFLFPSI